MNPVGECANFHQVYFVCAHVCAYVCARVHCLGCVKELHQALIMRPSCTLSSQSIKLLVYDMKTSDP